MASETERLNRLLHEALATERTLITTLQAHLAMTPGGPYRRLLERHLRETHGHAAALASHAHRSLIDTTIGLAETVAGQVLTLAKGPLDLLRRGSDIDEKLLKNARDECATEALEIALYDAIEALATQAGDEQIAELARTHRADEERMLADLRALIPSLAGATAEPPATPIDGYDQLNAGQVAARLTDLGQDDLAAVLAYEQAHRNRRAVVERAQQLTATPPWAGYDTDSPQAIIDRLNASLAGAVRDYESRHRRRVAILEAAQRELSGSA